MPGFRGKNLRSGDLAEQLGILLLQNVALVAPVPRTEDVGIDVVATLIRDFDGYKLIAEDSFFIQIKSTSVNEIIFEDEQVKWLTELQLPFFIASVDKIESAIYLYSTHYLSDVLVMNPNRKQITFEFNDEYDFDCSDMSLSIKIPLGPPIVSWSLETLANKDFRNEFYQLLKSHILLAKKSIETRRVGVVELADWKTGEKPTVIGTKININQNNFKIDEVTAPYFNALLQKFLFGEDLLTTRSLYRLFEKILDEKGQFIMMDGKKELIPYKTNVNGFNS